MTVYYWKKATGSDSLVDEHRDTIVRLLSGNYNHTDLEKLRDSSAHPLYSFRINITERLLFTTHKGCLHVLEYLPTHDYAKSRCFKKGVVSADIAKHGQSNGIEFAVLSDTDPLPRFDSGDTLQTIGLDYYNKQFITLSEEQKGVSNATLPLILSGLAGTGKSLLGLSLISQRIVSHPEDSHCLYITKEQWLAEKMQLTWLKGYSAKDVAGEDGIDFLSYAAFHERSQTATFTDFENWYNGLKSNPRIDLASALACYQEFRICSGFSKLHYCALGERQSSVSIEHRDEFYDFYQRYMDHLGHADPELHSFDTQPAYDLIVVDEAQNLSLAQNRQLARLAKNQSVIFLMDSHQTVLGSQSPQVLLTQCLKHNGISLHTALLERTHRYSQHVASALLQIKAIRQQILGGNVDKDEAADIRIDDNAAEGTFVLMNTSDVASSGAWLVERAKTTELAVVTWPEHYKEAADLFNTPLIFSPQQIIGQEFHTVVVFKLLACNESKIILKESKQALKSGARKASHHLPKKQSSSAQRDTPWIHNYFIAASRAMHTLVMIEHKNRDTEEFLNYFINKEVVKIELDAPLSENWEAMAEEQKKRGREEIANKIIEQKVNDKSMAVAGPVPYKTKSVAKNQTKILTHTGIFNTRKPISKTLPAQPVDKKKSQPVSSNVVEVNKQEMMTQLDQGEKSNLSLSPLGASSFGFMVAAIIYNDINAFQSQIKDPSIDLNSYDTFGATPLIYVVIETNIEMIRLLLADPRVDPNLFGTKLINFESLGFPKRGEKGFREDCCVTALMAVLGSYNPEKRPETIKVLLEYDRLNPNLTTVNGDTTLMLALMKSPVDSAAVEALLSDQRILEDTIQRIINNTIVLNDSPLLMVKLIKLREQVINLFVKSESLGDKESYRTFLQDIIDSEGKPESQQHPMYKVLFKKINHSNNSSIWQTEFDIMGMLKNKVALIDLTSQSEQLRL